MKRSVVLSVSGVLWGAVAFCSPGWSQLTVPDVRFPQVVATGRDAAAFAPKGWVVESQKSGDLNGDGRADLAFVLHEADGRNVLVNTELGVKKIDTNPRILCVAFAHADGQGYSLALQNHTLIPRWVQPTEDDSFGEDGGEIKIARGALQVSLHSFANAGGWDAGAVTFTFRFQAGKFVLIGFDNENHERNTGTDTSTSVNYLTEREVVVTSAAEGPDLTKQKVLPKRALLTMEQVGDGMAFPVPE